MSPSLVTAGRFFLGIGKPFGGLLRAPFPRGFIVAHHHQVNFSWDCFTNLECEVRSDSWLAPLPGPGCWREGAWVVGGRFHQCIFRTKKLPGGSFWDPREKNFLNHGLNLIKYCFGGWKHYMARGFWVEGDCIWRFFSLYDFLKPVWFFRLGSFSRKTKIFFGIFPWLALVLIFEVLSVCSPKTFF